MTAPGDCPKCEASGFANPGELAAHLIDAHDMAGIAALEFSRCYFAELHLAASLNSIAAKEEPPSMATKANRTGECPECHRFRHKPGCSQYVGAGRHKPAEPMAERKTTGRCGYCKRERPDHAPTCKLNPVYVASDRVKARKPSTRRHPKATTKARSHTVATNGLVSEIAALGAVAAALESLDFAAQANVLGCVCKLLAIDPTKLAA